MKHCGNCGTPVVYDYESDNHYDTDTGEKLYYVTYKCPKSRFYNSCWDKSYIFPRVNKATAIKIVEENNRAND